MHSFGLGNPGKRLTSFLPFFQIAEIGLEILAHDDHLTVQAASPAKQAAIHGA